MTKRKLVWQYWANPLGDGDEWVDEPDGEPDEDDFVDLDDKPVRPFAATPAGIVPIKAYHDIHKSFNFWMFHANFDIEDGVEATIRNTPGVEAIEILTPYRGRVAIGLAFEDGEVRRAIERSLGVVVVRPNEHNPRGLILEGDTRERAASLEAAKRGAGGLWGILVLPNGEIEHHSCECPAEHSGRIAAYREVVDSVGGVVFTSDDR